MFPPRFDRIRSAGRICLRSAAGFSLIELMVGVALLGVLAALAAPSMRQFLAAQQVADVARRLGSDLQLARNEAIKRNGQVLVCADASATACSATPLATDWAKGWRLCFDLNADGTCDAGTPADPNPIRQQPAVSSTISLTGPTARLQFQANGSSLAAAAFATSVVGRPSPQWAVNSARSGAITVRKTS